MSHEHHHPHHHEGGFVPRGENRLPPSREGTVVLDIGDGVGALVVHAPRELNGVEIEIAHCGQTNAFVHTEVRERVLPEGSLYAGVFVQLAAGDYTLLDVGEHSRQDVTIRSGHVTEVALTGFEALSSFST